MKIDENEVKSLTILQLLYLKHLMCRYGKTLFGQKEALARCDLYYVAILQKSFGHQDPLRWDQSLDGMEEV